MNEVLSIIQQIAGKVSQTEGQLAKLTDRVRNNLVTQFLRVERRLVIPHGLYNDREASPKAGSIYRATDTHQLLGSDSDGNWDWELLGQAIDGGNLGAPQGAMDYGDTNLDGGQLSG